MSDILVQSAPLAFIILIVAIAVRYTFKINQKNLAEGKEIQGIGGWLWFIAIGLVFGIIRNLIIGLSSLELLSSPDLKLKIISFFETITILLLVVFNIVIAIKFFEKKEIFILYFKYYYLFFISYTVLDIAIVSFAFQIPLSDFPAEIGQLFANILAAVIWISYLNKSIRVKNTFINY